MASYVVLSEPRKNIPPFFSRLIEVFFCFVLWVRYKQEGHQERAPQNYSHAFFSSLMFRSCFVLLGFVLSCIFFVFVSEQEDLAVDKLVSMAPGYSAQFEEVLRGCLQPRPEQRLRPEQLLELDWFQRFRRPASEEQGEKQEQEKEYEDDAAVAVQEGKGEGTQQADAMVSGDAVIILTGQGQAAGGEKAGGGGGGGGEAPRDGAREAWKGVDTVDGFESEPGGDEGEDTCEATDGDDDVDGDDSEQHVSGCGRLSMDALLREDAI